MRLRGIWITLGLIIILAALAALVVFPRGKVGQWLSKINRESVHLGLDLSGGAHLTYELDTSKLEPSEVKTARSGAIDVISKRVNALGVSEPEIVPQGDTQISVSLPGITDLQAALDLIGRTAQLEFWEQKADGAFAPTELTGADLSRADVQFDQQTNQPVVSLSFNAEGAKKFEEITRRNIGKPLAIILDGQLRTAPTVNEVITGGNASISGIPDVKEAKEIALVLNTGRLPAPLILVEQRTVGPTLGKESLVKSLVAGLIGLLLVTLFMVGYYRLNGFVAVAALLIYALISLSIFKLIPVTMTLAGVAGFILSIGMAVDANILIFERMKEERRIGKPVNLIIEDGFKRAWSSIRDSNVSTLITTAILYFTTAGLVRGFALTLAIGVLVSMFTAITVTRTLLRMVYKV
jgi:preprotein translocase subunit SecD